MAKDAKWLKTGFGKPPENLENDSKLLLKLKRKMLVFRIISNSFGL